MAHFRLRELAEPQRWNPHSLAEATGLAYNTVWGIWNNKAKRADLETLEALAAVLKVQPGDLIGSNGTTPKRQGLRALRGLGKDLWQQTDSTEYLRQERAAWDG